MEPYPLEVIEKFVKKVVKDPYGRQVGFLVGFATDSRNKVRAVEVEHGDGDFASYPCSQIMIEGDSVILMPVWEMEAEAFHEEFGLVQRRIMALDDMVKTGEVSQSIYDELHKEYEAVMKQLEEQRKTLIEDLRRRASELEHQIRELEKFLASTKMLYKTAEINEQTYKVSVDSIQGGLNRTKAEKKDVEACLEELMKTRKPHLAPQLEGVKPTPGLMLPKEARPPSDVLKVQVIDKEAPQR